MLREGFDVKNISVIVVLRSTESDLLLEQIVGRGLRLMFTEPEFIDAKLQSFREVHRGKTPSNSYDFLFIVEHPRFRRFYDELRRQGYAIGGGDSTAVSATGDVIPVDAIPDRLQSYDLAWPNQFFEEGNIPSLDKIDINQLPIYPTQLEELQKYLGKIAITETHVPTDQKVRTWKLENTYFDYHLYLRQVATNLVTEIDIPILTGKKSEVMELVDNYTTCRLFGKEVDMDLQENYKVLNSAAVFDYVVTTLRKAIVDLLGEISFEVEPMADWPKLSDVPRIRVRESKSVETSKSIYPKLGYSAVGGGFERDFMQ